jgi:2,4-diketo-3-deoxy-L-fuconate hydrolase
MMREATVRLANVGGRSKLLVDGGMVDVEKASAGRFSPDSQSNFDSLAELGSWAKTITQADEAWDPAAAGAPVPAPRQVFAVALNYAEHAAEANIDAPTGPLIFAKFVSSLTGPITEVELPPGSVDWEVELVAVIGSTTRRVGQEVAWDHVAGVTAGQDLSERELQRSGPAPQFGLAKSFPGFSPTGPALVTVDELETPDDIGLGCEVNGEEMQKGRTSHMIFSIPQLVSYLSGVVTLFPGDLIFTGTPSGVGMGRTPPRYLNDGDRLHSWIEGVGELEQTFVAPRAATSA